MLVKMFDIFFSDPQFFVLVAVAMVSALIVFLGALKPYVFDKIPNKTVRGSALFFSSIVLSFVVVAIAFWVKDWNFGYYIYASGAFSIWTIFVYSLYEYTRLRKFIHWLGKLVWAKVLPIFRKGDTDEIKKELDKAIEEMTKEAKKKAKGLGKTKHDKELDNV